MISLEFFSFAILNFFACSLLAFIVLRVLKTFIVAVAGYHVSQNPIYSEYFGKILDYGKRFATDTLDLKTNFKFNLTHFLFTIASLAILRIAYLYESNLNETENHRRNERRR